MSKTGKCQDCKKPVDEKFKLCYNCNLKIKPKKDIEYKKDVELLFRYIYAKIDKEDIQTYIDEHPGKSVQDKRLNELLTKVIDYNSDDSDDD